MHECDVTVIMPVHNCDPWLDESITSVRNQTYESFRFVIAVDASTDKSFEIAKEHEADDPHHRLIVQKVDFHSAADTRSYVIRHARTPFVAFADGDDRWHTDFLMTARQRFDVFGESMVGFFCGIHRIDGEGNSVTQIPSSRGEIREQRTMLKGSVNYDNYLLSDMPAVTASTVVIRNSARGNQLFERAFEPCEEHELWLRILDRNEGSWFWGEDQTLVDYRLRDGMSNNVRRVMAGIDRLAARHVPRMRNSENRWQTYETFATGARSRDCTDYAAHFKELAAILSRDVDHRPTLLHDAEFALTSPNSVSL